MKPYLYIVAVLLVGGSIGYFIGQRTVAPHTILTPSGRLSSNDRSTIDDPVEPPKGSLCGAR